MFLCDKGIIIMIRKILLKNSLWHKFTKQNIEFGHKHENAPINIIQNQFEVPDGDILDDKIIYDAENEFEASKIDGFVKYALAVLVAITISTIIVLILLN